MNSRPLDPQSSALTRLRYTPETGVSVGVGVSVGCKIRINLGFLFYFIQIFDFEAKFVWF